MFKLVSPSLEAKILPKKAAAAAGSIMLFSFFSAQSAIHLNIFPTLKCFGFSPPLLSFCQNVSDNFDKEWLANKGEECTPPNLTRDEKTEEEQHWQRQQIVPVKTKTLVFKILQEKQQ